MVSFSRCEKLIAISTGTTVVAATAVVAVATRTEGVDKLLLYRRGLRSGELLRVERVEQIELRRRDACFGLLSQAKPHRAAGGLVPVLRPRREALAVRIAAAREVHPVGRHDVGQLAVGVRRGRELGRAGVGIHANGYQVVEDVGDFRGVCRTEVWLAWRRRRFVREVVEVDLL